MSIMLRGEELIFRRERTVQCARVEQAAIRSRCRIEVLMRVGKGNDHFTLRECWQHPVKRAGRAKHRCGQSRLHHITARHLVSHWGSFFKSKGGTSTFALSRSGGQACPALLVTDA